MLNLDEIQVGTILCWSVDVSKVFIEVTYVRHPMNKREDLRARCIAATSDFANLKDEDERYWSVCDSAIMGVRRWSISNKNAANMCGFDKYDTLEHILHTK